MQYDLKSKDRNLYSSNLGWYIDATTPVQEAFVSHAHSDHYAHHKIIHCSGETAELLKALGLNHSKFYSYDFNKEYTKNDTSFSLYPAGHIIGSAQLFIQTSTHSVLYAGDVRLNGSRTCPSAKIVRADLLIIEGTYTQDDYDHLSTKIAEEKAINFVERCKNENHFPVFVCMSKIGKAQDLILALAEQGYQGSLQRSVYQMTEACKKLGLNLPSSLLWQIYQPMIGDYLIITAGLLRYQGHLFTRASTSLAFVSGWAADNPPGFDEYIAWSDHADIDELRKFIEKVSPQDIWLLTEDTRFSRVLDEEGYSVQLFSEIKSEFTVDFETKAVDVPTQGVSISNQNVITSKKTDITKKKRQTKLDKWFP